MSSVTNMSYMFYGASSFNQDVSEWDVSNVTHMSYMFYGASSFNQDVSEWDVSNVTNMSYMFYGASSFYQNVSGWNVYNAFHMEEMFVLTEALYPALQRCYGVSSFFEGDYLKMSGEDRHRAFAPLFSWHRRQAFAVFLANQGYLLGSHVDRWGDGGQQQMQKQNCDVLFDVEDLYHEVCKYL